MAAANRPSFGKACRHNLSPRNVNQGSGFQRSTFKMQHYTGLCKKVGAGLQENFSPAAASLGRPCQAGA